VGVDPFGWVWTHHSATRRKLGENGVRTLGDGKKVKEKGVNFKFELQSEKRSDCDNYRDIATPSQSESKFSSDLLRPSRISKQIYSERCYDLRKHTKKYLAENSNHRTVGHAAEYQSPEIHGPILF